MGSDLGFAAQLEQCSRMAEGEEEVEEEKKFPHPPLLFHLVARDQQIPR
jgi:hypothetical protein